MITEEIKNAIYEDKVSVEYWEADEYVISIQGIGVVGQTLRKKDSVIVKKWLETAIDEIQKKNGVKNEIKLQEGDKFWMGEVPETDDFGDPIKNEFIDGRTNMGPWALMSKNSFRQHGVGIGQGKGQLYRKESNGQWKKIKG